MHSMTICPVCNSAKSRTIYQAASHQRHDRLIRVKIVQCDDCLTVFLGENDHQFKEELYAYYQQYAGKPMEEIVSSLTLASYHRVLTKLRKHYDIRSILDVGCGKGEFVWTALGQGFIVEGLELSVEAVSIALSHGLPVQKCSLFASELDNRSWSAITMFEVLEHVDQPISMINRATDLLENGGILYLTTPNFNSLDRLCLGAHWQVFHPEHITYFSTRGLARLMRRLEPRLQIISLESTNISPQLVGRAVDLIKGRLQNRKLEKLQPNTGMANSPLDLRSLSEGTRLLRRAKNVANRVLSVLGIGSTTIITAKKVRP